MMEGAIESHELRNSFEERDVENRVESLTYIAH